MVYITHKIGIRIDPVGVFNVWNNRNIRRAISMDTFAIYRTDDRLKTISSYYIKRVAISIDVKENKTLLHSFFPMMHNPLSVYE